MAWKSNFWNANGTFAEAVCKSIQRGIVQKFKKGESKQTTRFDIKKVDKIPNRLQALKNKNTYFFVSCMKKKKKISRKAPRIFI